MTIETELCKAIVGVFQSALTDVEVRGNWIEGDDKGVEVYEGRKLEIKVGARRYDSYTSRIAEFAVTLDGTFAFSEDTTIADTVAAYEKVMSVLEGWHADINAVKRDLTLQPTTGNQQPTTTFEPVGLRLEGGDGLVIDEDDKERHINQQFTIKGRIIQTPQTPQTSQTPQTPQTPQT